MLIYFFNQSSSRGPHFWNSHSTVLVLPVYILYPAYFHFQFWEFSNTHRKFSTKFDRNTILSTVLSLNCRILPDVLSVSCRIISCLSTNCLGLRKSYLIDEEFAISMRMFTDLAFIPCDSFKTECSCLVLCLYVFSNVAQGKCYVKC